MKFVYVLLVFGIIGTIGCSLAKKTVAPDQISYTNTIGLIMNKYCTSCHSVPNASADLSLTTYEQVKFQTEKGDLLKRINDVHEPMPKSGLMKKDLRDQIAQWAKNGYPYETKIAITEPVKHMY